MNDVVTVGNSGIGGSSRVGDNNVNSFTDRTCFFTAGNSGPTAGVVFGLNVVHGSQPTAYNTQLVFRNGRSYLRSLEANNYTTWYENYSQANTTRSSDGTLKAASPVVKLFADGTFITNDESEGCTVTRKDIGEYLIEGCEGLNADAAWGGWDGGFDIPTDRNKQPLIWLDYEVNVDGSVLVKIFHRTHPEAPDFARNERQDINDCEPVDIPRDQFVSVRVQMPLSSIWNQRAAMNEFPDSPAD